MEEERGMNTLLDILVAAVVSIPIALSWAWFGKKADELWWKIKE